MSQTGRIRAAVAGAAAARKAARSWSIAVPKGWEHEAEDALDTFFDPDGDGALQISSFAKASGDVTERDLTESIEDMELAGVLRRAAAFGPFVGYSLEREEDGQLGQYWFLRAGPLLLFVTYFCDQLHAGKEARIVAAALSSLRLAERAGA
ncbi:MAG: hypothetical protein U1F37_20575 [Alphaproteobacteria bacterium]